MGEAWVSEGSMTPYQQRILAVLDTLRERLERM
jgi:hypothetical protein